MFQVLQVDDGTEVLEYFSKTITDTERNYSTYDSKLLSIYAAVKYFKCMLLDKAFTIQTDSQPIVHSFQKPSDDHTAKQVCQLTYLLQFDCTIQHIRGTKNQIADCLSQNVPTLTVSHTFQLHVMPFTLSKIAIGLQSYTNIEAFNFSAASHIAIKEINVPDLDMALLIDTSQKTYRVLLPPHLEKRVISHYYNLNHVGLRGST